MLASLAGTGREAFGSEGLWSSGRGGVQPMGEGGWYRRLPGAGSWGRARNARSVLGCAVDGGETLLLAPASSVSVASRCPPHRCAVGPGCGTTHHMGGVVRSEWVHLRAPACSTLIPAAPDRVRRARAVTRLLMLRLIEQAAPGCLELEEPPDVESSYDYEDEPTVRNRMFVSCYVLVSRCRNSEQSDSFGTMFGTVAGYGRTATGVDVGRRSPDRARIGARGFGQAFARVPARTIYHIYRTRTASVLTQRTEFGGFTRL
jgi:hypothetical protein